MIKRRRIPRTGIVASLASRREIGLRVRRIVRLVEVRHVAAQAARRRPRELPADVASVAVQRDVRPGESETGELQMVELRTHPVVHGVALVAADGQSELHVVDPRGLGVHKVALVA